MSIAPSSPNKIMYAMLIYNVTSKVDWAIAEEWVEWMQDVHIPAMISTGCFIRFQFVRLVETEEEEGPTYAVQYYAATTADYDDYLYSFEDRHSSETTRQWGDKVITFTSLMEVLNKV